MVFVFLFLTYFTLYDRLEVHHVPCFIMIIIDILLPVFLGIHIALMTNPSPPQ